MPRTLSPKAGTYATGVTYFPDGGMSGFTYGNTIVHSLTQNTRGLPLESKDANGTTAILDDTYSYDENGNVAGIADGTTATGNSRTMVYDSLDRLMATNASGQWWVKVNRPGFPRHLGAILSGNDGGVHERRAVYGRVQG